MKLFIYVTVCATGMPPVGLSLFFDFLLPLSTNVSLEDFISRHLYGHNIKKNVRDSGRQTLEKARRVLWENLHAYTAKVVCNVGISG
jgi:hypothetical protein